MMLRAINRSNTPHRSAARWIMLALCSSLLGGCAALGGVQPTADTYDLGIPEVDTKRQRNVQILIAEPVALKAVDAQDIVIETGPREIQYLGDARWADRLPRLVQQRLADAFQNTGAFAGVGLPGQGLAIDYQFITEIRSFAASGRTGIAQVSISAKLLDDRNGDVVSSRVFTATARASSREPDAYVAALDSAFASVARDMIDWVSGLL